MLRRTCPALVEARIVALHPIESKYFARDSLMVCRMIR